MDIVIIKVKLCWIWLEKFFNSFKIYDKINMFYL